MAVSWGTVPARADENVANEPIKVPATHRQVFEQALADYDAAVALKSGRAEEARRLFAKAAHGFQTLADGGIRNGRLYYDLANTQVRLGRIGEAIANYRRADRLMPGDENIRRNLQYARKLSAVNIAPPALSLFRETVFFWHYRTPFAGRLWTAVGAYVAFWGILLVMRAVGRRPAGLVWTARTCAALAMVLGASAAWESYARQRYEDGVLVTSNVTLRKGNGEHYDPQLAQPLPEGVEFEVIQSRKDLDGRDWYYIRLPDGKDGWLRSDQAELI